MSSLPPPHDGVDFVRSDVWAGVVVPPSNPTIEPELAACVPKDVTLFTARFPVMKGTTLEQRNPRYLELYPEAVGSFGGMKLSSIMLGLTGPSYRLLAHGDEALCRKLSIQAGGIPVCTASHAILQALAVLGARRLCLFSPYPEWLTNQGIAYWHSAGHDVVQVVKVSGTSRAYDLTEAEVSDALARVDDNAIDATVMSGTGMLTLPAVLAGRRAGLRPILSSNLCAAWWLLRTGRRTRASSLFDRAAPELAADLQVSRTGERAHD